MGSPWFDQTPARPPSLAPAQASDVTLVSRVLAVPFF